MPVVLVCAGFLLDALSYSSLNPPGGKSYNTGNNGIWLRYLWYFGKKSDKETEELVTRLKANQIKYAFFHVRSTDTKGK